MTLKNKLDVADLEKRYQDALEFQREGPRKATLLPRWVIQERFSTLRKFEGSGDVNDTAPRGYRPMGVAAIEAFKCKAKGKGKKGKSKGQSGDIWNQDWRDDRGDHGWFDRGDDWRDDQWGWNREWHGDARDGERSEHRRWDNDSWDV